MKLNKEYESTIEKDAGFRSKLVGGAAILGALGGSTAIGTGVGNIAGSIASIPFSMRGLEYAKSEPSVNTVDYIKRNAPSNVRAITSDTLRSGRTRFTTRESKGLVKTLEQMPSTAFYAHANPQKKWGAKIIAANNSSPSILAHEVGHHAERLKNPKWRPNVMREIDAWKMAPQERGPYFRQAKKNLLRGYKAQAGGTVAGGLGGLLAGAGLALKAFKRRRGIK